MIPSKLVRGLAICLAVALPSVFAADCKTATVGSPDSTCFDIYTRAGITSAQFSSYNPGLDCSKLQIGQKVCISSGTLPSNAPKPSSNGTCYEYFPVSGDYCAAIATKFSITTQNIEDWNKKTFKWTGCANLQIGFPICVSTGNPPPVPVDPNQQCGQQSAGNKTCPLNACCSAFGFCGLTDEFCATTGSNPCQSNCGTPTLPSCSGSATRKIGYYAGWASRRTCTTVNPDQLDLTGFTHMNFAFATIGQDLKIALDPKDDPLLKGLVARKKDISGLKVLISVGGWAFSEDDPTKDLFSKMVSTAANRKTFITSVVSFLSSYSLDGIDVDFEYPGAAERNAPASDTPNLTAFAKELKAGIPSSALFSIAAPAGYWFLRGFEINKFADSLSYINMMSYDYHGPWDTNVTGQAPVANPHTSIKDMKDSAILYTRAGIDLKKVNLGLAWYGRTFHLASSSCKGYNCTMTGGGAKGSCTGASGILAQFEVLDLAKGLTPTLDTASQTYWFNKNGDLITYDQDDTWAKKKAFADSTCFGGTFVWSNDEVTPKPPVTPPADDPPKGCKDYDFVQWTKASNALPDDWAKTVMDDDFIDSGEGACFCWDTVNWHTYNGLENMINYIWAFGLQNTNYEDRILFAAPQPRLIENSGTSHDDALWGALLLMKLGEYYGLVKNDQKKYDDFFNQAIKVMHWVEQYRMEAPCAPGVFWEAPRTYKNTIVNALYLHASLRAYGKTGDKGFLNNATDLYTNFFEKYNTIKNGDGLYVDGLGDDCKAGGHGQTWTYNEGVMLSSLGYLYKATGDRKYLTAGNDLINAVRAHMTIGGILAETICDPTNTCNFDQEGFKGIFVKHMQYFYDAVGNDPILKNKDGWHSDWLGLIARGVKQYARRKDDGRLGSVWYGAGIDQHFTGWTDISGFAAGIAATKYGTCSK